MTDRDHFVNRFVRHFSRFRRLTSDKLKDILAYVMKRTTLLHGSQRTVLPTDPKKDVRLSCRVDEPTRSRLFGVAKRHCRRPSLLIRHAVEMFLELVEAEETPPRPKRKRSPK